MTTRTEMLPAHTPELFAVAVERAVRLLRAGEVVALPTETVYGLAANAFDAEAVARIFEVKGRPAHNPIICHVASLELARRCAQSWPPLAQRLADAFWPGPLTLVVPRAAVIPSVVAAGGDTVGLRWPAHPFMQAVIRACDFPLAAPSANLSNRLSPTTAEHVRAQLDGRIPLIVDGGAASVGIESTVVDASVAPPRLLRPGMIHEAALLAVTGELQAGAATSGALRSPGLLRKHYSPRARLFVLPVGELAALESALRAGGFAPAQTAVLAHTHLPSAELFQSVAVLPREPAAFARGLYAALHEADQAGCAAIVVETLPAGVEWRAVADRLARAAAE